jgi:polysaccharide export outer membrane protein
MVLGREGVGRKNDLHRRHPLVRIGGQPGQYAYVPGMTVQNAIAVAGGFSNRANQSMVDVTRKINGQVLTGRVNISGPIIAGDTIYVRERLF